MVKIHPLFTVPLKFDHNSYPTSTPIPSLHRQSSLLFTNSSNSGDEAYVSMQSLSTSTLSVNQQKHSLERTDSALKHNSSFLTQPNNCGSTLKEFINSFNNLECDDILNTSNGKFFVLCT